MSKADKEKKTPHEKKWSRLGGSRKQHQKTDLPQSTDMLSTTSADSSANASIVTDETREFTPLSSSSASLEPNPDTERENLSAESSPISPDRSSDFPTDFAADSVTDVSTDATSSPDFSAETPTDLSAEFPFGFPSDFSSDAADMGTEGDRTEAIIDDLSDDLTLSQRKPLTADDIVLPEDSLASLPHLTPERPPVSDSSTGGMSKRGRAKTAKHAKGNNRTRAINGTSAARSTDSMDDMSSHMDGMDNGMGDMSHIGGMSGMNANLADPVGSMGSVGNVPAPKPGETAPKRNKYADKMNRNKKKKRKAPRIIATLVVVAAIAGGVYYFVNRNQDGGEEDDANTTAVVTRGMLETYIEGDGTTAARKREELGKDAKGEISQILVEVGDEVTVGQELIVIDPVETRKELEAARKEVTSAQQEVENARREVESAQQELQEAQNGVGDAQSGVTRAQEGVEKAKEGVVKAQEGVVKAQEGVTKAQAKVEEAQKNMEKLTVTAPFSGKVIPVTDSDGNVTEYHIGQQVSSGQVIGYMVDDSVMTLSLDFSSAYSSDIQVGQVASISIPSAMSTVIGSVSTIEETERVSEEGVKLFRVNISVPNLGALAKDMSATAAITTDNGEIYPANSGTLAYSREEEITTQMGGEITEIGNLDHYPYEEGETIVSLISEEAQNAVEAAQDVVIDAEEAVETAQEAVKTAEDGVKTAEDGVEDAQKQVANAQRNVVNAQKTVADRQKSVAERQKNVAEKQKTVTELNQAISDSTIKATIDGIIVNIDAAEGSTVAGSAPLIVIADLNDIIVNANITATDVPSVEPGQSATMTMYLPEGETIMTGTVQSVGLEANQDNNSQGSMPTFPAVISIDPVEGQKILSGYPVQYQIVTASSTDCLIVPSSAVVNTESGTAVFAKPAEGQTFQDAQPLPEGSDVPPEYVLVPVDVGISDATNTEILWGVDEGTTVYLAGPEDLYASMNNEAVAVG